MSFLEPILGVADSILPVDLGFAGPPRLPPVNTNIPRAETAFRNKYQTLAPVLPRISPAVRASLINFDLKRIQRGQTPLPLAQTAKAIQAATTGQAATAAPRPDPGNIFGNTIRNVTELVSTIPRLPLAIAKEAKDTLTQGPTQLAEAFSQGNPVEIIHDVANVPGVRLLPGAYVLSGLTGGKEELRQVASNPLMAALDVLPFAQPLARATPVAKAQAAQRATLMSQGRFAPELRPLRTVLTRTLDEQGVVVPNVVGRAGARLAHTRPGQVVTETFGQQARHAARLEGQANVEYKQQISPEGLDTTDPLVQATRDAQTLNTRYGVDETRAAYLWTEAQRQNPYKIPDITDAELAYLTEAREVIQPKILGPLLESGELVKFRGEIYDAATARRLHGAESRFHNLEAKVRRDVLPRLQTSLDNFGDERIAALIQSLESGDYAVANRIANGLYRGKTRLDRPQAVTRGRSVRLQDIAPADATLAAIGNIRRTLRDTLAAQKRLDRVITRTPPARFQPLIGQRAAQQYAERNAGVQLADADTAAQMAEAVLKRDLVDIPGWNSKEFQSTVADVSRTWQQMRDAEGLDPVFVHRVTPGRAEAARRAGVQENVPSISQAKERVADISPSVQDISVSLSHQGMELLARRASEEFIHQMLTSYGVNQADLARQYAPAARARASYDPRMDYASHLKAMIDKEWTRYNPDSINWATDRFNDLDLTTTYIPKTVANNLKRSHNPSTYRLTAIADPITNVFRTSILPLSPRWHVYNIFGGAIMSSTISGPGVFKHINEARGLLRALREGDQATVQARLPRELTLSLGSQVREAAELRYRSSLTLRRLFEEAGQNSPVAQRFKARAEQLGGGLRRVTDRSFEINQMFDDMYRVVTYLNEYDKSVKKGAAGSVAERTAIETARRVIQQWDEYTPIERQVLRHVMPFYGFTQHIMRFAFKYPFDHPIRASILGTIARNEIEDLGTGLPTAFLDAFFFGEMDENGHQKAISLRGINPFRDVANMMTLAGFAQATNPIIGTVLEQMGLEQGTVELYPNLRLDPTTGRLVAQQENPFVNFLHNTIPQSQVLTALLGVSTEFKDLLRTNPAAARRMLLSQGGLPIMYRDYDLPAEYFKAEVKRQEAESAARTEALKTGNYTYAERFPGLAGLASQVQQLQARGALAQFEPTIDVANPTANPTQSAYANQLGTLQ